jgi:hypothetical protein
MLLREDRCAEAASYAVRMLPGGHAFLLQGMVARKGVAATMMGALAKANVNIKAIAQVGSGNA